MSARSVTLYFHISTLQPRSLHRMDASAVPSLAAPWLPAPQLPAPQLPALLHEGPCPWGGEVHIPSSALPARALLSIWSLWAGEHQELLGPREPWSKIRVALGPTGGLASSRGSWLEVLLCLDQVRVHMGLIRAALSTSLTGDKRGAAFTAAPLQLSLG